jgi:hypothetical protein
MIYPLSFSAFILPCRFTSVIRKHLTILLADSDHKLVYAHGSVDGDFSAKIAANVMSFDSTWSML